MAFKFSGPAANAANNKFRQARVAHFNTIVNEVIRLKGHCKILDIGGTNSYWQNFGGGIDWPNVSLTILNLHVSAGDNMGRFICVAGDARDARQFAAGSFDIVHSNSVIEHVGLWDSMQRMANEVRRIAPRYFIQTPSFWFPLEAHARLPFFQFMPEPLRLYLLQKYKLGYLSQAADIGEASQILHGTFLLTKPQMQFLFPDAVVATERLFGLPKAYIAIKA